MLRRFVKGLCAVTLMCTAALSSTYARPALAQVNTKTYIDEHLSAECLAGLKGPVKKPTSNGKIGHQYMLLLVFKKGTGSKYFGKPDLGQYGCIPDAEGSHDAKGILQIKPANSQLMVATCPNDCSFPFVKHEAMNDGADPLGTNAWGIASAIDSAPLAGGPGRHIEVWEVPVSDACHARVLYAFNTAKDEGVLTQAYAAGDMLGEILVGYRNGKRLTAPPTCP